MERELPNVRMLDELPPLASRLCEEWVATKNDVLSNSSEWDEEPFDKRLCAKRLAMIPPTPSAIRTLEQARMFVAMEWALLPV